MEKSTLKTLQEDLDGALSEYVMSMSEMCKRLDHETEWTEAELLHFISNETAKCLADYKTAILDAFAVL